LCPLCIFYLLQGEGSYSSDSRVYPPLATYAATSPDWVFEEKTSSLRSKYKKVHAYIASELEMLGTYTDESSAVAGIIRSAVQQAVGNGAEDGTGSPSTARDFYDSFLVRLPNARKRKRASPPAPLTGGSDFTAAGADASDLEVGSVIHAAAGDADFADQTGQT
jgi:hypothetical protein